tara:strand:+ start:24278 stop:24730 length:453 start_codon:yes stop_codon:yes gene_type:complete
MADQDKHDKSSDDYEEMETTTNGELLKELFTSIDVTIDKNNDSINDLETLTNAVALNTAKTGITTSQASAITANTAKTGITSSQSSQISDNALAVATGRNKAVGTSNSKVSADISPKIYISKTAATLTWEIKLSDGSQYTAELPMKSVKK